MKIVKDGDDAFRTVMEASDAHEETITSSIEEIERLLADIKKRGWSREIREKDRCNRYWRYSHVERSLDHIIGDAQTALRDIKFLDIPKSSNPADPSRVFTEEPHVANEESITRSIEQISTMIDEIFTHGYSLEIRKKDQHGEVERMLRTIDGAARAALRDIKFLDFPELSNPGDPKGIQ